MQRARSFFWQFCVGGGHLLSFSHELTVSNGLSLTVYVCKELVLFSVSFLSAGEDIICHFHHELTVSNGLTLTVYACKELALFSGSFVWRGGHQPKYVHLPNLSSLFQVLLFLNRALLFLIRTERPTRCE